MSDDRATQTGACTALFLWQPDDRLRNYVEDGLRDLPAVRLVYVDGTSRDAWRPHAASADVIVGWRPRPELLEAATRASLLICPGAGVQHLIAPVREVNRRRRLRLTNGHGNAYFTAQHTVALLLALANRVVQHHVWMSEGRWRTGDDEGASVPLRDRVVGLLGYGAVNRQVHRMLAGFGARVAVLRRSWPDDTPDLPTPVERFWPDGLDAFLAGANALVIAVPLTDATRGLIGARELDILGRDGLVVNVGRGEVVDQESLYLALRDGRIAGAALDVWYDYRPAPDDEGRRYPYSSECPFHLLPNVVLSPHRAASPFHDLARWDEVIDNIRRVATGRVDLRNEVDLARGY